jgi:hypothetical protein
MKLLPIHEYSYLLSIRNIIVDNIMMILNYEAKWRDNVNIITNLFLILTIKVMT